MDVQDNNYIIECKKKLLEEESVGTLEAAIKDKYDKAVSSWKKGGIHFDAYYYQKGRAAAFKEALFLVKNHKDSL